MHRNPFFTMPIKAVILDMDGTLIHFTLDTNKARTRIIEYLENNGYPKGRDYGLIMLSPRWRKSRHSIKKTVKKTENRTLKAKNSFKYQ